MERAIFLIESTGQTISCLLNPESVVLRRAAGVRVRHSAAGELSGAGLSDDPILYTGGGRTQLDLDLLFDVNLAGSTVNTPDVRELTRPLWTLAENIANDEMFTRSRLVRFVWGKAWNIPGVVSAIAERLEQFTPDGVPQRSWLRLRLLRVGEVQPSAPVAPTITDATAAMLERDFVDAERSAVMTAAATPIENETLREVHSAAVSETENVSERLDVIAFEVYGAPWLWRLIALLNAIDDPLHLAIGTVLRLPPIGGTTGHHE